MLRERIYLILLPLFSGLFAGAASLFALWLYTGFTIFSPVHLLMLTLCSLGWLATTLVGTFFGKH